MPVKLSGTFATEEYSDFYYCVLFSEDLTIYFEYIAIGSSGRYEKNISVEIKNPESTQRLVRIFSKDWLKPVPIHILLNEGENASITNLVSEGKFQERNTQNQVLTNLEKRVLEYIRY